MNLDSTRTFKGETSFYYRSNHSSITFGCPSAYATDFISSYTANFPIFSSLIEAENYLKGTFPATDALNYAKTYQIADWLQDDWKGLIIDPLANIGLTLTQLIDLAKALGLHAIGNNISAQELLDLLKAFLSDVDPGTKPGGSTDPDADSDVDPVAPCFEFPVVIPALNYKETVKLDMSIFDDAAEVMRICEKVSFVIFLMFATSKVIRW